MRGWAAYYRGVVSSKVFASLDDYLWKLTYKWACCSHPNKPKPWIVNRYFGKFNKFRNDRWVFGDRDSGAYLPKLAWTNIVRHTLVKGGASPDDPDLAEYWAERRRKSQTPARCSTVAPALQAGRALHPVRGRPAARRPAAPNPTRLGTVVAHVTRKAMVTDHSAAHGRPGPPAMSHRLVHASCHRAHLARVGRPPALHPESPSRLA